MIFLSAQPRRHRRLRLQRGLLRRRRALRSVQNLRSQRGGGHALPARQHRRLRHLPVQRGLLRRRQRRRLPRLQDMRRQRAAANASAKKMGG